MLTQYPFCEPAFKEYHDLTIEDELRSTIDILVSKTKINPIIQHLMVTSLANFVLASIDKFAKGQQEHGGDIRDRDLTKEITQETIDLFWYNEAKKWPSHLK